MGLIPFLALSMLLVVIVDFSSSLEHGVFSSVLSENQRSISRIKRHPVPSYSSSSEEGVEEDYDPNDPDSERRTRSFNPNKPIEEPNKDFKAGIENLKRQRERESTGSKISPAQLQRLQKMKSKRKPKPKKR